MVSRMYQQVRGWAYRKRALVPSLNELRLRRAGASAVRLKDLMSAPRSSRLFVLAPGASVATLEASHWSEVREHMSLGINYWIAHPFRPDLTIVEMYRIDGEIQDGQLSNLRHAMGHACRATDPSYVVKASKQCVRRSADITEIGLQVLPTAGLFATNSAQLARQVSLLLSEEVDRHGGWSRLHPQSMPLCFSALNLDSPRSYSWA